LSEHKQEIVSLFPHAGVKVISGTQHWLHAEKPDIFVGIVKRFLD
jgi:esterase